MIHSHVHGEDPFHWGAALALVLALMGVSMLGSLLGRCTDDIFPIKKYDVSRILMMAILSLSFIFITVVTVLGIRVHNSVSLSNCRSIWCVTAYIWILTKIMNYLWMNDKLYQQRQALGVERGRDNMHYYITLAITAFTSFGTLPLVGSAQSAAIIGEECYFIGASEYSLIGLVVIIGTATIYMMCTFLKRPVSLNRRGQYNFDYRTAVRPPPSPSLLAHIRKNAMLYTILCPLMIAAPITGIGLLLASHRTMWYTPVIVALGDCTLCTLAVIFYEAKVVDTDPQTASATDATSAEANMPKALCPECNQDVIHSADEYPWPGEQEGPPNTAGVRIVIRQASPRPNDIRQGRRQHYRSPYYNTQNTAASGGTGGTAYDKSYQPSWTHQRPFN